MVCIYSIQADSSNLAKDYQHFFTGFVKVNDSIFKNICLQLDRISYFYYRMIGEHFPKVSQSSRQNLKSHNTNFVMDECARNNC